MPRVSPFLHTIFVFFVERNGAMGPAAKQSELNRDDLGNIVDLPGPYTQ